MNAPARFLAACCWLALVVAPARAAERASAPVLGTMPAYPGATRPLPRWETARSAIALTRDKPAAVVGYYISRMTAAGWRTPPGNAEEAIASAGRAEPAWLTFIRPGMGRLDLQVTRGRPAHSLEWLTLVTYQATPPKP